MNERSKTSRREFLNGRAAVKAIQAGSVPDRLAAADPFCKNSLNRQNAYLEYFCKNAMACEFALLFNMQQYSQSGSAAAAAFERVDELEDQLSIFRIHSELSRLNRAAKLGHTRVEDQKLFKLLRLAARLFKETDGAFDITSGPLTEAWGFDLRKGSIPQRECLEKALTQVGMDQVVFDDTRQTVFFEKEGLTINLGGIGKGYALDRMAELISDHGVFDFLIHGGQSSVVARGTQFVIPETSSGKSAAEGETKTGWWVGLSHPLLPDSRLAEIRLSDEALGTSGTGRQGFFHRGKRYGHVIDPRTGWPSDHFLSATVISPSAAASDALATAFFVMSIEDVEAYCREHLDVKAILVSGGVKPGRTQIEWFNLDNDDWHRL